MLFIIRCVVVIKLVIGKVSEEFRGHWGRIFGEMEKNHRSSPKM